MNKKENNETNVTANAQKTIHDLRLETGMSQRDFAIYFDLPVRTVQEWEQNRRQPPTYLITLLQRLIEMEAKGSREE